MDDNEISFRIKALYVVAILVAVMVSIHFAHLAAIEYLGKHHPITKALSFIDIIQRVAYSHVEIR